MSTIASSQVYEFMVYDGLKHERIAALDDMFHRTLTVCSAGPAPHVITVMHAACSAGPAPHVITACSTCLYESA